jgi:secreted trypsin-like serine protease
MRLHALLSTGVALGAMIFGGCAVSPASDRAPTTGTIREAIVAGEDDANDPAVVALLNDDGNAFCTGVLISSTVVATAAHCVEAKTPAQVFFGTNPSSAEGTVIAVAHAEAHPDFDPDTLDNDIALVTLARESRVRPMPVRMKPLDDAFVGEPIRLVGFGIPSADAASASLRKRSGTTTIEELGSNDFRFNASPSQTCLGDSGGPAFATIAGRESVIGIASSGDSDCKSYGRHTRADRYAQFITSYLAANAAKSDTANVASAGCTLAAGRPKTAPFRTSLLAGVLALLLRRRSAGAARARRQDERASGRRSATGSNGGGSLISFSDGATDRRPRDGVGSSP